MDNELLPCPFCGKQPEVQRLGTYIDIECCCSMSHSKCGFLTIAERETWSDKTYVYSPEAEQVAWDAVKQIWNTRKTGSE